MTRVLENAGAVVTRFSGRAPKVDAFSRHGERRAYVVLNSDKQSSCRSVWDMGHECGHLVLHRGARPDVDQREREAHYFAGALLLPRRAFMREYRRGSIDWPLLFDLKQRWRASVAAILHRAFDLELIDAERYRRANLLLRKRGWHRGEPYEPDPEEPETIRLALNILEQRKDKPPKEIARLLHWRTEVLEAVTGFVFDEPNETTGAQITLFPKRA